jgi:hypothetical protein
VGAVIERRANSQQAALGRPRWLSPTRPCAQSSVRRPFSPVATVRRGPCSAGPAAPMALTVDAPGGAGATRGRERRPPGGSLGPATGGHSGPTGPWAATAKTSWTPAGLAPSPASPGTHRLGPPWAQAWRRMAAPSGGCVWHTACWGLSRRRVAGGPGTMLWAETAAAPAMGARGAPRRSKSPRSGHAPPCQPSPILPFAPDRLGALLQPPWLSQPPHASGGAARLDPIRLPLVPHGLSVPRSTVPQALGGGGGRHRPRLRQSASHLCVLPPTTDHATTGLFAPGAHAGENSPHSAQKGCKIGSPSRHCCGGQQRLLLFDSDGASCNFSRVFLQVRL